MDKLCIWSLGLAIGVVWAIGVFIVGITAIFGWGNALVDVMGSFYIGYHASFGGAIIGAIWGFVDGFIGGALIAFFMIFFAAVAKVSVKHHPTGVAQ